MATVTQVIPGQKMVERNFSPRLSCFPIAPHSWGQEGLPRWDTMWGWGRKPEPSSPHPYHFSLLPRFSISSWALVLC